MWVVELIYQYLSWIWVLLLVSLPSAYHRLYIPLPVGSYYLMLGVGGLCAIGLSQFSCFLVRF